MLLKRFSIFLFLFSLLLWSVESLSQYKGSSDFLYGRWKSKVPYYLTFQAGIASSNTFYNNDFVNEGNAFSWGISFEKPLGYRPLIYLNFRSMGRYTQSHLENNSSILFSEVIRRNTSTEIESSFDFSINYSYLFWEFKGWQYRASAGLGVYENKIRITDTVTTNIRNNELIVPIQLSTGRSLFKRIEVEFGYKYYIAFSDQIDGFAVNNNYDKYSYAFVALKYMFGEKDYRFMKKGSCPTAE